LVTYEAIGLCE